VLVDPGWLAGHLRDADLRVVEVDVSPAAYDSWHIDGAVLWNVYTDLKDCAASSHRPFWTAARS
jgi:thiosulfate/3-mercaptopyruvate sulfurtransferase